VGKEAPSSGAAALTALNPSTDPLVAAQYAPVRDAPPAPDDEMRNLMDNKEWLVASLQITVCCNCQSLPIEELDGPAFSAEAKQRFQWSVIGWVTKIYYLELLRASEGTFSRWSRLYLQSLAPTPISRRVDVRQAAGRKNSCRIFITT
jgi:hypothetical protein